MKERNPSERCVVCDGHVGPYVTCCIKCLWSEERDNQGWYDKDDDAPLEKGGSDAE